MAHRLHEDIEGGADFCALRSPLGSDSVPNIGVHTVHDAVVDDFHIPYEFRLVTVGGD